MSTTTRNTTSSSTVRCTGTWIYESTAFFSRKTEEKKVPAMLEFQFDHHPDDDNDNDKNHNNNIKSYGQCAGTSKITLFNSTSVPPPAYGKSEAMKKVVNKQREEATKCTINFFELVNVHIVEDQLQKAGAEMNKYGIPVDEKEGSSLKSFGRSAEQEDKNDQVIVEDKSPLTLAITFCVRAPGAPTAVKGTEDIFATPAERQDSSHPLRSIKFVITAIAASGGEKVTGGETPYKSMHDRFVDRVLHPIESFLLPEGRLHIFPIVSPVSGQGKGIKLYTDAQKIFRRSHHLVHPALITKYRGHAEDWMANSKDFFFPVDPTLPNHLPQPKTAARSVIVAFGGDGMIHEVINGWFRRELKENQKEKSLIETAEAFDRRPFFLPFPTGSGCAVAAALGVIEPVHCAMAAIHCHWTACDSFVLKPTGPARVPIFPKAEVVPPSAADASAMDPKNLAAGNTLISPEENSMFSASATAVNNEDHHKTEVEAAEKRKQEQLATMSGDGELLPPSWDCMSWAKLKNKIPPPRLGLLSISTGLISDVDKGSETMRYLGNTRFAVEMVRTVFGTTPKYNVAVKYLPVLDPKDGKTITANSIDNIEKELKFKNSGANFPEPSIASSISAPLSSQGSAEVSFQPEKSFHDKAHSFKRSGSIRKQRCDRLKNESLASSPSSRKSGLENNNSKSGNSNTLSPVVGGAYKTETSGADFGAEAGKIEQSIGDFSDDDDDDHEKNKNKNKSQSNSSEATAEKEKENIVIEAQQNKWIEYTSGSDKDKSYIIMISNIVAIAKDCIFAPYARFNDGALDVVGIPADMGKVDLTSILLALEDGTHVSGGAKDKIKYVKATEVQIDAKNGLIMCDGEIVPQCPLNVKCCPRSLKLVRTTLQ